VEQAYNLIRMGRVKLPLFFYAQIEGTGVAKCGRNVAEEIKMWQNVAEIVHLHTTIDLYLPL